MNIDVETKANIEVLKMLVIPKIKEADKSGKSLEFGDLGVKYGSLGYQIFMALDKPQTPVLLPPWTIYNRTTRCDCDPDDPETWNNSDMLIGLYNFLEQSKLVEEED